MVFNRVMLVFSTQLCVLLYCPSNLLSGLPPPFPKSKYCIHEYRQYVAGGGGGGLSCVGNHIMQVVITLFLTRSRTYKIDTPPKTKP